jgi:hypothetical protein
MSDETKFPPDDYQPEPTQRGSRYERPPRVGEPGFEEHLAEMRKVINDRPERPLPPIEDKS